MRKQRSNTDNQKEETAKNTETDEGEQKMGVGGQERRKKYRGKEN